MLQQNCLSIQLFTQRIYVETASSDYEAQEFLYCFLKLAENFI